MTWTLVIFIYAAAMSTSDSVALTTVPGFATEQGCREAAALASPLAAGTLKVIRTVCLPVGR